MAVSIEELDATVRAFYEGRGESVSISWSSGFRPLCDLYLLTRKNYSKKLRKLR